MCLTKQRVDQKEPTASKAPAEFLSAKTIFDKHTIVVYYRLGIFSCFSKTEMSSASVNSSVTFAPNNTLLRRSLLHTVWSYPRLIVFRVGYRSFSNGVSYGN
jgi:hypothetical protein